MRIFFNENLHILSDHYQWRIGIFIKTDAAMYYIMFFDELILWSNC